jgi:hypothetical protein
MTRIHLLSVPSLVSLQALLCSVSLDFPNIRVLLISLVGFHCSRYRRFYILLGLHFRSV